MAFKTKSTAERLAHLYEGATIFYHRILYSRQGEILHACTERGEIDWRKAQLLITQDAVDGWDNQVLDADDHPLQVPGGTDEERRQRIATIVSAFPTQLIFEVATLAFADDAETVRKNLPQLFPASSGSPPDGPGMNGPATTADATVGTSTSPSPVTPGD